MILYKEMIHQYNKFTDIIISHQGITEAITLLQKCIDRHDLKSMHTAFFIYGDGGLGKTSLAEYFERKNPPYEKETDLGLQTIIPVYYTQLPSNITYSSVIESIYSNLNCKSNKVHPLDAKDSFLKNLDDCEVKIIIIDEVFHLMSKAGEQGTINVRNWLKDFIDYVARPVIFIGTDEVLSFFDANRQSTRRTKHRYKIEPFYFPIDSQGELYTLVNKLLGKSEEMLGINTESISNRLTLSQQLFLATSGVIDYIRSFIDDSVLEALENDSRLTTDIFSGVFNKIETSLCLTNSNPFNMSEEEVSDFIKRMK